MLPGKAPRTRRRKSLITELLPRLQTDGKLHGEEQLVREMVETCLKLLRDRTRVADVKLLNAALRELRYAFKVFAPYAGVRKVSIFGSARTRPDAAAYRTAHEFARRIAAEGYMVITGAGSGIMRACQEGAGRERSFGVNIRLPFEQEPNEFINKDAKLTTFRYFFTRKLIFMKEADAVALFPGGFGTHDEAYECLTLVQTGKTKPMPIPERLKLQPVSKTLLDEMSALCDAIERQLEAGETAEDLLQQWHSRARRRCDPRRVHQRVTARSDHVAP